MKKYLSKEIIYLFLGSLIVGYLLYRSYSHAEVLQPQTSKIELQMDSIAAARKQKKMARLEFWYDEMLSTAYTRNEKDEQVMAKEAFFLAKSIFPDRMEPRINLVRVFSSLCYDKGFFCYDAIREIKYAHKYVDSTDVSMVHELDSLNLLVKDVDYQVETEFIQ